MYKVILASLAILALLAGCAPSGFDELQQTLDQGVGKLTYAQAEEKWGEPLEVMKESGKFTPHWQWLTNSGFAQSNLYITFDNNQELMRSFRYESKPTP